ncbi:MAG: sugar ABC transporter substrate-binding protein [Armatimonadota bacterium]
MSKFRRAAMSAVLGAAVLAACGCPKQSPPSATAPGPATQPGSTERVVLAYSISSLSHQFFVDMLDGVQDEAKREGAELLTAGAGADAGKQLGDVEDLLQKDPSVMMITPQDSDAIRPAVAACNEKGVPVVIIDIGASGGKVDSFIISDNYEGGRLAGTYIAEHVPSGSRVAHIRCQLGAANARQRGEGFAAVMRQRGLGVIPPQPADSKRDLAMTVMENLLQANEEISAVFAENDPMAVGAMLAAENAGRLGEMIVVGFNGDPEALDAIRDGKLAATVMQFPYDMGVEGVRQAMKLARGERASERVEVPVELVTADNIEHFEGYRRKRDPGA